MILKIKPLIEEQMGKLYRKTFNVEIYSYQPHEITSWIERTYNCLYIQHRMMEGAELMFDDPKDAMIFQLTYPDGYR